MLLITDEFVYHSLLTEMFYLHMVVFTYMFSVNHVKVTCHSLFANASYECGTDFYLFFSPSNCKILLKRGMHRSNFSHL